MIPDSWLADRTKLIGLSGIRKSWLSNRTKLIELSGIRKVFMLGRSLEDPVNLSIGQPHFYVPEPIKACESGRCPDATRYALENGTQSR